MMMPVTSTTASGYAMNNCQGRSDDAIQWINEWQAWAGEAPPGSGESRDIAMQRLRFCLDHQTTVLDLSNLGLTELPEHLPPFLEELDSSNNQLIGLPARLPVAMKKLNVSHNQLTHLPVLPVSLEKLYVSDNQLTSLPVLLPDSLRVLYVTNNHLMSFPAPLPDFLREVGISLNQLMRFPAMLPTSLKKLNVTTNHPGRVILRDHHLIMMDLPANSLALGKFLENIRRWSSTIDTVQWSAIHLEESVNYDQGRSDEARQWINEWQAWAGNAPPGSGESRDIAMQRLRYCIDRQTTALDLSNLSLTELPEHLPPFLEELDSSNNQLIGLPAQLPVALKWLNVSDNQLTHLPVLPVSLETLGVGHNQLTSLPDCLPTSLKNLYVSYNQLTSLPVLPVSLETLGVKYNQLTSLPDSLPASLLMLDAGENQLTSLPVLLPPSLKAINLDNNPLNNTGNLLPYP